MALGLGVLLRAESGSVFANSQPRTAEAEVKHTNGTYKTALLIQSEELATRHRPLLAVGQLRLDCQLSEHPSINLAYIKPDAAVTALWGVGAAVQSQ
jgi:hypothetical protein